MCTVKFVSFGEGECDLFWRQPVARKWAHSLKEMLGIPYNVISIKLAQRCRLHVGGLCKVVGWIFPCPTLGGNNFTAFCSWTNRDRLMGLWEMGLCLRVLLTGSGDDSAHSTPCEYEGLRYYIPSNHCKWFIAGEERGSWENSNRFLS